MPEPNKAKSIMLMGTGSHVGKSILATALARIFYRRGIRTVPFKAQNMALNSFVTRDGREMGRAQVAQAEAAGLAPDVRMNPVLLKPTGEACSQVILDGLPVGTMSAREYHQGYALRAFDAVKASLEELRRDYELLVVEGAGSPAEVNLKGHDIVNMRVAKYLHAPVLLIADIDRGGALAALVGTLELLDEEERGLVRGLVINKFRGDVSLFTSAVDFLEKKTGKPVLGVLPFLEHLGIDEEDSVTLEETERGTAKQDAPLRVCVVVTPQLSNYTDFDALAAEPDVDLCYAKRPDALEGADLILLGGSKNTMGDLSFLYRSGFAEAICAEMARGQAVLAGICGGYQMLGTRLIDRQGVDGEHERPEMEGLGFFPMETVFTGEKILAQTGAVCLDWRLAGVRQRFAGVPVQGYEIHAGRTAFTDRTVSLFEVRRRGDKSLSEPAGALSADGRVLGTYLHGLFDTDGFRRSFLNALRERKGLAPLPPQVNRQRERQAAYDRLADAVEQNLDMRQVVEMIEQAAKEREEGQAW